LRAAQLMTNEKQLEDALTQVNLALENDPEPATGWLIKGQLLIGLERYAEAARPLEEYVTRMPGDALGRRLAELARRPESDNMAYVSSLLDVLRKQGAKEVEWRMARVAERLVGPNAKLLEAYRQRIE